jgi:hypothetical protein
MAANKQNAGVNYVKSCPLRSPGSQARKRKGSRRVPQVGAAAGRCGTRHREFAIQNGPSSFAIFDTFDDESGRDAHLSGKVAAALMAKAGELLAKPPAIHKIDILADKLPKK